MLSINFLPKLSFRHGQWGAYAEPSTKDTGAALLSQRYDLIVGSDLLYEPDMPKSLARFVDTCANPNAEVWIVDPNRGYRTTFNKKMAHFGFQLSSEESLTEVELTDEKYKGRLLIYNRS